MEKTVSASGKNNIHFSVRVVYKGRRVRFPLETANKNEAASKATLIFKFLTENGWEKTIEKYKEESAKPVETAEPDVATVGDLIVNAAKYTTVREQSFRAYKQAFRKIVADIMKISGEKKNATVGSDGNREWKYKVDSVALVQITPSKVQSWRQSRINETGKDASAKRKAAVTANSQIRNAKALFSKKILPFLKEEIELPDPLPFQDIQVEKKGSLRYHSRIDASQLLVDAEQELKEDAPEAYKVFLLALVCGLRVSEIDYLLWESIDFERGTLHVRSSEYHLLKSEDSEGIIDLSESTCRYLQSCVGDAVDDFVVVVRKEDCAAKSAPYRSQKHFNVLRKWLRSKGVREQKPIHTLRKEIGSLIATEQGIFAASRYLRHADIQVTAAFYADKKNRIVPSIGL